MTLYIHVVSMECLMMTVLTLMFVRVYLLLDYVTEY